jgi:lipopolysaccharide/colanic/teichoic acid biosynthesis glycosyltransferase
MKLLYWLGIIVLIIVTAPVIGIVALGVAVTSGFPVFFSQKRAGKDGKPFRMYKFRTMNRGAERQQKALMPLNEARGPVFKLYNDPRYTRFGRFLAHTGLDELPQVYNVLRGDMALLGPRPLPVGEEKKLHTWQKAREQIKPGIFSPWILEGYHRTTFDAWMRSDIAYAKNKSFLYDLGLTLHMIVFMVSLIGHEIAAM